MFQRLFAGVLLIAVILWLVFSYVPAAQLPTLAYPGSGAALALPAVVALVAFVALQTVLIVTTAAGVRKARRSPNPLPFRLPLGAEIIWTAVPLFMTLLLAWASLARWEQLTH